MKSTLKLLLLSLTAALILTSCEKDENSPKKIIVKMGAQSNTTIGAFYSIGQNKVYTQDLAYTKQDTIDLLCFYEHDELNNRINDITISSPGANITGIFTGETSPDVWTVKRLTTFTLPATEIDTVTFDQLKQDDEVIESYYNSTITSGNKKAKLLQKNDIYAFLTHDSIYGLFRVLDVALGVDGYVEVELKLKK
jgi:co-chaperonin GroES (HSP10)